MDNKEFNDFKIEVLTQLAVINSKIDGYNKTQEIAVQADNRSKQNELDIKEMKDNNTWAFRTSVGAIISNVVTLVFIFVKLGMGLK